MIFQRQWDESCPRVWAQWEADGRTWAVQDLRPEDDEAAIQMMVEHWLPDEPVCSTSGLLEDPESLACFKRAWKETMAQRMSLACYTEVEGKKTLVGLNVCLVLEKGEQPDLKIEGRAALNAFGVLKYLESKSDPFEKLGLDKALEAFGLVVAREYRGSRLGGRILAAREPLCRSQGIKGTATMFTGPASQKLATNCGFTTISEATWSELADAGLNFPKEDRIVKLMIKKYD
ncbi:hypothetical protein ABMA27_011448 [Loxostege sticticalis]|uniref:N-acetyltransferase domain-containing protein n=1 Tax=Loxostege sticticalis TaxID=481309 RepID=A0ABR3IGD2_LOXSC